MGDGVDLASGLSSAEAAARLARDGPNRMPAPRRPSAARRLAAELVHFFAVMLWAAGGLAFVPEMVDDGRTGFLCTDAAEMSAAVGRLGTIDRAAYRAAIETGFTAPRMVAEHVRLYEDVLAGRAHRPSGTDLRALAPPA